MAPSILKMVKLTSLTICVLLFVFGVLGTPTPQRSEKNPLAPALNVCYGDAECAKFDAKKLKN
jgi:hypothetical protein